jgi:hypothetical protein
MRYASIAAGAALCLGLVAAAGSASLAEEANAATCQSMEAQVRSGLDESGQSANRQEIVKQRDSGRQYCARGFYRTGMEHFAQALKLLGSKT